MDQSRLEKYLKVIEANKKEEETQILKIELEYQPLSIFPTPVWLMDEIAQQQKVFKFKFKWIKE